MSISAVTVEGVEALAPDDPLVEQRQRAAETVGSLLIADKVAPDELRVAHEILEWLSKDAELRVRRTVANAIAGYPLLPVHIAERLASDVMDVALPVLQFSRALSDDFLVALVREDEVDIDKALAVARRPELSESVSQALVDLGKERIASALVENNGARITTAALGFLLDTYRRHAEIPLKLVMRPDLPPVIVRKCHELILADEIESHLIGAMRTILIHKYRLPDEMADDILRAAREDAIADRMANEDPARLAEFVRVLRCKNLLTGSLLLRSVCGGDLAFFKAAFAELADVSPHSVEATIAGSGTTTFRDLYFRTGLPSHLRHAITVAVEIVAAESADGRVPDPKQYLPRIVDEIVDFYRKLGPEAHAEVMSQIEREAERWAA